jgi:hypothetical protein
MSTKVKHVKEMAQLEKEVIQMIFKDVEGTPDDGQWRKYERGFIYEATKYLVKCFFKIDNQYLTYKQLLISHDTQLIELPQGIGLH